MKKQIKSKREPKTFFGVSIVSLVLVSVVFSHIGWWVENIARIFLVGVFDARFYYLPFISAYGIIPFAFHGFLRDPRDMSFFGKKLPFSDNIFGKVLKNFIAFIAMVAFVLVAELIVGNLWDWLFGVELWNYSSHPLHITQYTGIITSLAFGAGAFILYKTLYKWLLILFKRVPYRTAHIIAAVFGTLIMIDTAIMILYMGIEGEAPMLWSVKITLPWQK